MSTMDVLLADVGGTHVRFALAGGHAIRPERIETFEVLAFPTLADAATRYLQTTTARPRDAVIAVAGRVEGGTARMTNHPWTASAQALQAALGCERVRLVNDFAAQARSIALLERGDCVSIGAGQDDAGTDGVRVVAGAGTGLGVGAAVTTSGITQVLATEAGHVGFAPASAEDRELLDALARQFPRVSNERLISGPGLVNLYRALAPTGADTAPQPADIARRAEAGDPLCSAVLERFFALFGQIVGDLVLAHGAWQGAYLTGGMVPRLLPWLLRSRFRERFEDKGRFAEAMRKVPVYAVTHPQPGLLGAAGLARDMPQVSA